MSLPIRILVADDSDIVRSAIRSCLGRESSVAIVGEVASYRELVRVLSQCAAQVVLLDMHMPDEGRYAPEFIKALLSHFNVLAMSAWSDAETKALAERYGAIKLLEKCELGTCLTAALHDCVGSFHPQLH
jgi:DNA-binding NarL/FixJ family response regulator